jgi:hypothetical protein
MERLDWNAAIVIVISTSRSRSYFLMRVAKHVGIAATALALSLPAMAKDGQQSTNQSQLVAANAVLQTTIDAKTAKVGDVVTAKLTSSVQDPGGPELKRNTLLIGHIDQVQAATNNGVSSVVLTFDKAQPKGGQPIAIKSTIVGIFSSGTNPLPPDLTTELKVEQLPSSAHGYSLSSDVQGTNSGVLKAEGKNVRVGGGTGFQFAMAPVATGSNASGN